MHVFVRGSVAGRARQATATTTATRRRRSSSWGLFSAALLLPSKRAFCTFRSTSIGPGNCAFATRLGRYISGWRSRRDERENTHLNVARTMKSIVYGPRNAPRWQEQGQPTIHAHQVLVQVHAVGLNPVDAKGVVGDKLPHNWTTLQGIARRCIVRSQVIGFDFAGCVVQVGRALQQDYRVGDYVYGIMPPSRYGGTVQEYVAVPSGQLAKLPPTGPSTIAAAAALPLVGITAYQCLVGAGWECPPTENTTPKLLVLGASGGTGHVAVQVGRCLQPEASIVAVCSERNMEFVRHLTTNLTVLDYRDANFLEQLRAQGPFDVVMDCVTSGDPRDQATVNYEQLLFQDKRLLAQHSQYRRLGGVFSDWCKAGVERTTHLKLWSNPRAKLFWIQMHETAPILRQLATWMEQGKVQAHVGETVPFSPEGVEQGFTALLGRRVVGKVVLVLPPCQGSTGTVNVSSNFVADEQKSS